MSLFQGAWPDRSALTPAVGELVLKPVRAAIPGVGGLALSLLTCLGCLMLAFATIRGLRLEGPSMRRFQ